MSIDKKRHSKPFKEIELCDLSMGFIYPVFSFALRVCFWLVGFLNLSTRDSDSVSTMAPQEIPWDLEDGPLDQVLELNWSGPFRLTRDSSMGGDWNAGWW